MIGKKTREQCAELPEACGSLDKLQLSSTMGPQTPARDRVRWKDILKNDSSFSAARKSLASLQEDNNDSARDSNIRVSCSSFSEAGRRVVQHDLNVKDQDL